MPEPGIKDFNVTRPTTGRNRQRRKSRPRVQIPLEYADFALKDGRTLIDVMGPGFFESRSLAPRTEPVRGDGDERVTRPEPTISSSVPNLELRPSASASSTGSGVRFSGSSGRETLTEKDPWLDGSDFGPVPRKLAESDAPQYLLAGQSKFHDEDANALDRIAGAAWLAASSLYEGPYGVAHEDLGSVVNQSREDAYTPILGFIRTLNEVLIEGGSQLGDLTIRTIQAPVIGGAAALGQTLIEMGATTTTAGQIMRDVIAFADAQTGSPTGGAPRLGTMARKGKKPKHFRPVETTLLFDDAERSGALATFLNQFPPGERGEIRELLRQSYIEGHEVAANEVRRRGSGHALVSPRGALAELELRKFEDQWHDRTKPIRPNRIYGSAYSNLPPEIKLRTRLATNSALGAAGERHGFDLARIMDPRALPEVTVETPPQFARNRRYDFVGRRWSDRAIEEAYALYAKLRGREANRYRALAVHSEAKTGGADLSASQRRIDAEARANPGSFGDPPVTSISNVRIFDYQIPIEKAFRVLDSRFDTLVKKGRIDEATKEALLSAMISMREGGKKTITLADYADLYTQLVPAAAAEGAGPVTSGGIIERD